ncbi:MAG: hypothetical protein E7319_01895 [Clostridiales bacterium]|nr:hypothetical protein [Clostridiales bacterium]
MLKLKYLFENFDLAKNCIELWDHDPEHLEETLGWFRISSNAVYPFRQKDGLCFLRLCPAEEKPLADVESEIAIIQWLRAEGFPAMEPVPMKDGRLCARLATPWGGHVASCFRQVAGKPLEDIPAAPALVEGYGRCLGQLHRLMQACPYGNQRRSHRELLRETEQRLATHQAPPALLDCCRSVEHQLSLLPITKDNYGLIHYDFEPDNVFCDPQTGLFAVIDFDDMLRCWYALDVVRALDGLCDVGGDTDTPCQLPDYDPAALFLRGYRTVRSFTDADEAALPVMRRLVQLVEYAGLLHVLSEEVQHPPEWMVQLRWRLEEKMRWLAGELEM